MTLVYTDNIEAFKYLDWQLKIGLPQLVLAIPVRDPRRMCKLDPRTFKLGREWHMVAHQTAGHGCNQHYMYATILKPRPEHWDSIHQLCNEWLDSDAGMFSIPLAVVLAYRESLWRYFGQDVDCWDCYREFEEGIYPIDCTPEALSFLSAEEWPEDLDDLVVWESDMARLCGCIGRWRLYILGQNCD